jgi:hypothetical protein
MKFFTLLGLLFISTVVSAQTTQLKAADCGSTLTTFSEIFSCDGVANATNYEFTFVDQSTNATTVFERPYHTMALSYAGLYTVGASYDVTVKARVGGVLGAVGATCSLNAPANVPTSNVEAISCGAVMPNFTAAFYCSPVQGATAYEFQFTNTATSAVTTSTSTTNWNSLGNAGLFDIGATYDVRVRAIVGGTTGTYGATACNISAPATVPTTELRTVDCGATMGTFNQTFKCNAVANAVEYEFEFNDAGTITTVTSPYTSMSFVTANLFGINVQYDVRVRAKIGSTFGAYGPVCTLNSPAIIPFTSLVAADCGSVLNSYTQVFKCTAVAGATLYEFEFEDVNTGVITTATNTTRGMTLSAANLVIPNAEYLVRVRTTVGGVQSAYGIACTVFAPATIPLTKVADAFCGLQTTAFTDVFSCDAVQTATEYEWEFTDVTTPNNQSPAVVTNTVVGSENNDFDNAGINDILLDYNKTFSVKVRAKVGGVWGNFGLPCIIKTPITIPIVQLNAASCGSTVSAVNQLFGSTGAAGATQYEFEFTDITIPGNPSPTVTNHVRNHFTNSLLLAGLPDIGKTYEVRIRAFVGGQWGSYGPICTLSSPPVVPTTQIKAVHCGTTVANFGTIFYADGITGADEYEFEFTNTSTLGSFTQSRTFWSTSFTLAGVTDVNTTFDIRVRARIGTEWSAFGSVCSITTPAVAPVTPMPINNGGSALANPKSGTTGSGIATEVEVSVYPNPATNFVNINVDLANYSAVIYDLNGRIVHSANNVSGMSTVNLNDIAEGLYVVMISDEAGNVVKTKKFSVTK